MLARNLLGEPKWLQGTKFKLEIEFGEDMLINYLMLVLRRWNKKLRWMIVHIRWLKQNRMRTNCKTSWKMMKIVQVNSNEPDVNETSENNADVTACYPTLFL